jgi:excisionase family DNA binding protein
MRIELERMTFAQQGEISTGSMQQREFFDEVRNVLMIEFRTTLLARRVDPQNATVRWRVPASPWQHAKAAWFPTFSRWLRRPPRYIPRGDDYSAARPARRSVHRPPTRKKRTMMPNNPHWLSTTNAAKRIGVTPRTLYGMIDKGQVPAYRFGRVLRLKVTEVDGFIDACRVKPGDLAHLYPEQARAN